MECLLRVHEVLRFDSQPQLRHITGIAHWIYVAAPHAWGLSSEKLAAASMAAWRFQPWSNSFFHSSSASGDAPVASKKISVPTEQTSTSGFPSGTSFCRKSNEYWPLSQTSGSQPCAVIDSAACSSYNELAVQRSGYMFGR